MKIKGLNEKQEKILINYMIDYFGDGPDGEEFSDIKTFSDVAEFLMCAGKRKEELSYDYLTSTYSVETDGLKFCVDYSQYRKDGGLCDGDWGKELYVLKSTKKAAKKTIPVRRAPRKTVKKIVKK